MVRKEFLCETPEKTAALGFALGNLIDKGSVVLLSGGLGAGKTLFAKGIAKALGIDENEVSSPSFSLVNRYSGSKIENTEIYHIDLWRLGPDSDFDLEIGLSEILDMENAIVLIEWSEHLGNYELGGKVFRVIIKGEGEEPRIIQIIAAEREFFAKMGAGETRCG
ncbi:MAG: tRNA (adenosine(37)-N6)-threonylcarbamoyltransferase complex ATPase subunit type 1 TsaE [Blastocatellia bacterium]